MPNLLPSRYIATSCLGGTNVYFDTGVYPTNNTNVECVFYVDDTTTEAYNTYLFGARNSNSNTSAGQLNMLIASTSYLGFASARTSISNFNTFGGMFVSNTNNEFAMTYRGAYVIDITGSTSAFTGTKSMYILAMNNGGSVNYGSKPHCFVYKFFITQGGTKIKEYYPVYDTQTSQFGLYDFVNDAFLTASGGGNFETSYLWEVQSGIGGRAYCEMPYGEVNKIYLTKTRYITELDQEQAWTLYAPFRAVADEGYVFLNWTDQNGNVLSTNSEYSYAGGYTSLGNMILKANFIKKPNVEQMNPFQLLGLKYGTPARRSGEEARKDFFYAVVDSFTINQDSLGKTTSTIICREIPSAYQTDMPVVMYDSYGRQVWVGLIEAIDGNTLKCRESLAVFDIDFQFTNTATDTYDGHYLSEYTVANGLFLYFIYHNLLPTGYHNIAYANPNQLITTKYRAMSGPSFGPRVAYDKNRNLFVPMPTNSDVYIGNMEEYIFEIINQFGLGFYEVAKMTTSTVQITIAIDNPLIYSTLVMGDNNDFITNINVTSEMQENNVLVVFDEVGTTVRGQFAMKNDGTIVRLTPGHQWSWYLDFLGATNCKAKLVMSDDNLNTLTAQYLTNSFYNHKITFDIDLNNRFVTLDDFKLGRRVDFHIGDKLYHSIVTGKSYSLAENEREIHRATITLGNVRTSLTSKLNLGMVK